jgi:ferrous iron transport protein A
MLFGFVKPLTIKTKNNIFMKTKDLTQLTEGESGVVVGIQGGDGLTRRLESMGIRVSKKVTKVSSQLMRGPVTLRVDNCQVAMGFGMARKILVETEY